MATLAIALAAAGVVSGCARGGHESSLVALTGCVEGGQEGRFLLVPSAGTPNGVDSRGREQRYRLAAPDTLPLAPHVDHEVRATGQVSRVEREVDTVGGSPNGGSPPPQTGTLQVTSITDLGSCGARR